MKDADLPSPTGPGRTRSRHSLALTAAGLSAVLLAGCQRSEPVLVPLPASSASAVGVAAAAASAAGAASDIASAAGSSSATSCPALQRGRYRLVTPRSGQALGDQSSLVTITGGTPQATRADGSMSPWAVEGACRFSEHGPEGDADIVVTSASVLLGRYSRDHGAHYNVFIGFPEQTHTVSELAGEWSLIGMTPSASGHTAVAGSASLDAQGRLGTMTNCGDDRTWSVTACETVDPAMTSRLGALQPDRAGGFDLSDAETGAFTTRMFAYRAPTDDLMMVSVSSAGFAIWTSHAELPLPKPGPGVVSWNLDMKPDLSSAGEVYETRNTVTAVDAATASWTRAHVGINAAAARQETLVANSPRPGYAHRAPAAAPVPVAELTLLRIAGMGFVAAILPQLKVFEIAADEPAEAGPP